MPRDTNIIFNNVSLIEGIEYDSTTGFVTFTQAGTYELNYGYSMFVDRQVTVAAELDGVEIPGSRYANVAPTLFPGDQADVDLYVVTTMIRVAAGQTLAIVNEGAPEIGVPGADTLILESDADAVKAYLNLKRVA